MELTWPERHHFPRLLPRVADMQVIETTNSSAGSLLIVDDNDKTRELLSRCLEVNGYTATGGNGKQALELVSARTFDLILLDLEISDMDGLDVLNALRQTKTPTELPVLVLSANHQSAEALSLGANDYATKPVD